MAYKASLTIDDLGEDFEEVPVYRCDYDFSTDIDLKTGHRMGAPRAGLINITIDSTKNTSIFEWLTRDQRKDGTLFFNSDTIGGPMNSKKVKFTQALCVGYREVYESNTGNSMRCHFSIWCQEIKVGDSEYVVSWKDEF